MARTKPRSTQTNPQRLSLPQLTAIHIKTPEEGKALQAIQDYVNVNVTPKAGNKIMPKKRSSVLRP